MKKTPDDWNIRREYLNNCLTEDKIDSNPFAQFNFWYREARESSILEPNAMALATSGKNNKPAVRFVLCKGFKESGLYFYTNYESSKGTQISENPQVAATFYWDQLERQVRIEGLVKKTSNENSDKYFQSRPRESQIAAACSEQSKSADSRKTIEESFYTLTSRFAGQPISRPDHWGGYLIEPDYFEFWQGRTNRLHDRITYKKSNKDSWIVSRLCP